MNTQNTIVPTRIKNAILVSSDIGKKDGKIFGVLNFRYYFKDGSYEEYRKFLPTSDKGLEVTKPALAAVGLKGKFTEIHNQGTHNQSKTLQFGKEFEIEIQEMNGKFTVGNIRKPGITKMRSSISQEEAEMQLGNIQITGEEE